MGIKSNLKGPCLGLIGCGNWGRNILRDLIKLECETQVVDPDPAARDLAAELGALRAYSSVSELPACDGYVVAVPIPDLTKECARLLPQKKPIFAEKTLCLSLADYARLKSLGGAGYIFAMHKWHYHPGIEALRLIARSDRIGRLEELCLTRHAWVNDFHGGDVFWTQSVHDLTIIKHILGAIPAEIRAIKVIKDNTGLPVSLTAMLGHDPAVTLNVSGRHCNKVSGVSLHGQKGSAELYDAYDDHLTVRNAKGEEKVPIDTAYPLYLELQEFVAYLQGGPAPRCDLESAKEVTQAILNLRKKAGL
ncbi:MAG: Gfo/Idh/MocA family oxidoreductase [Candidatus Margulisiibacteriota bacterium]